MSKFTNALRRVQPKLVGNTMPTVNRASAAVKWLTGLSIRTLLYLTMVFVVGLVISAILGPAIAQLVIFAGIGIVALGAVYAVVSKLGVL